MSRRWSRTLMLKTNGFRPKNEKTAGCRTR